MDRNEEKEEFPLPDFDQLNDRIILGPSQGPFLQIRTNLDREQEQEQQARQKDDQ